MDFFYLKKKNIYIYTIRKKTLKKIAETKKKIFVKNINNFNTFFIKIESSAKILKKKKKKPSEIIKTING